MTKTDISKFLSYVLRHQPEFIGLTLDSDGWANIQDLIKGAAAVGKVLDLAGIREIVETSDKKRFSISPDGMQIRAVQGHSTESVELNFAELVPPPFLYHGTAARFLESIRAQGLKPGSRHYVHLSADPQTALAVGQRHGRPVVLTIAAATMVEEGYIFHRAENGVWLTKAVPIAFIREIDG